MTRTLRISGITHNGIRRDGHIVGRRQPLVHLLADTDFGDVVSINFHPDDAPAVAAAIRKAGRRAKAGRKAKPIEIDLKGDV